MRLQCINFRNLIAATYACGVDGNPVSVLIAAETGAGKSFAAAPYEFFDDVLFINTANSPQEHRSGIGSMSHDTKLLINDDLGLSSRWNFKEYVSTFIMTIEGHIGYKHFKKTVAAYPRCSVILLMTNQFFDQNREDMEGMGLLDRCVKMVVKLSDVSLKEYQKHALNSNAPDHPDIPTAHDEFDMSKYDLHPRQIKNMRRISKYLSIEQFEELVSIQKKPEYFYEV